MIWKRIVIAAAMALTVAPAEAGFWGDLKQSFGTAVDNAGHDGADAVDAISGGAGDPAVESAQSAADLDTGDSAGDPQAAEAPAAQPPDNTAEPVADGSKQLTKQPTK